jgi:hypothetical protein
MRADHREMRRSAAMRTTDAKCGAAMAYRYGTETGSAVGCGGTMESCFAARRP